MNFPYTDGFFNVSSQNGFLPIKDPLDKLPNKFYHIQKLIDNLPDILNDDEKVIVNKINDLPIYILDNEVDIFVLQALFRAYTFLTSAYLLKPKKALNVLPIQLARPLVLLSKKLDVAPWLDYHYAYSLGNYVKTSNDFHWSNLKMACSFTNSQDEIGFIMNHVYINEMGKDLIKAIESFEVARLSSLKLFYETMKEINTRRATMWKASDPKKYTNFRRYIMGIKGNEEIFGPGVIYNTDFIGDSEIRSYRGQTGAQDDIIPTADIFTGLIKYYPENDLTKYLLDLRTYRPKCIQNFFKDLEKECSKIIFNDEEKIYILLIVDQIYNFRNGHWQFVQKYILENTKYPVATGGTPVTTWIPNQIGACLNYMDHLMKEINNNDLSLNKFNEVEFNEIKKEFPNKVKLLSEQLERLKLDSSNIFELNKKYGCNEI